tara:strand:- start:817 stop:1008 length:192 start_codon:yes stop_codon:yes gene_type:complete
MLSSEVKVGMLIRSKDSSDLYLVLKAETFPGFAEVLATDGERIQINVAEIEPMPMLRANNESR